MTVTEAAEELNMIDKAYEVVRNSDLEEETKNFVERMLFQYRLYLGNRKLEGTK